MILVTGATGAVGGSLVRQAVGAGVAARALVRDPAAAAAAGRLPEGVEAVRGDLSDPASVGAAAAGAEAVFLVWPFLSAKGAEEVVAALVAAGVRRVVYLSMAGLEGVGGDAGEGAGTDPGAGGDPITDFHSELQRVVRRAGREHGLEWVFLQPTGFMRNTLGWAESVRGEGVVRAPGGDAVRSLVHERDIAAVGLRALLDRERAGDEYLITGPRALSHREYAAELGRVLGREVAFDELTEEQTAAWAGEVFGDAEAGRLIVEAYRRMAAEPEPVTDVVERVTGRPPADFREWVREQGEVFG